MFQTTHQWYIRYKPMNTFPPFQTPEVSDRWSGLRQILSPWILRFFPWTRCQTFHGVAGVAPIFRPSLISLICCFHHFPSFSITFHHFPSLSIIFHHFPSFSIIFHHFPSFSIIFHHFPSLSITFHHFPSFSITFHHFPSLSIIFHLPTFSSCFFFKCGSRCRVFSSNLSMGWSETDMEFPIFQDFCTTGHSMEIYGIPSGKLT